MHHGLSISGAALDDAEHSLANLDFRDQLARRLFYVRYVQRPFLSRSRPVAYLVVIRHSLLPPRSPASTVATGLLLGRSLFVCVSTHPVCFFCSQAPCREVSGYSRQRTGSFGSGRRGAVAWCPAASLGLRHC